MDGTGDHHVKWNKSDSNKYPTSFPIQQKVSTMAHFCISATAGRIIVQSQGKSETLSLN
jgi:hypothetical protein